MLARGVVCALIVAGAACVLVACGGGGGVVAPPAGPAASPAVDRPPGDVVALAHAEAGEVERWKTEREKLQREEAERVERRWERAGDLVAVRGRGFAQEYVA